jgi:hypothetical protein
VAVDSETGGRLDVSWNHGPDADVASYTVHYGPTRALGSTVSVPVESASLIGLADGTPYFVAVTATNTSDLTSSLSNQVSATPTLVLGLKSPGFVSDLLLSRVGTDAELMWGAIATDIYGKALVVDHYEVFRSTSSVFVPTPGNRIGTTPTPSFTDAGALVNGLPDYHYLVRAVDSAGSVGGAGNQLPDGILNLEVQPVIGGNLVILWPEVATDFDGAPIEISHYEVYASDTPFRRADIRDGLVAPIKPEVTALSVLIFPEAQSRYYSVLAVDARGNRSPF